MVIYCKIFPFVLQLLHHGGNSEHEKCKPLSHKITGNEKPYVFHDLFFHKKINENHGSNK
jgi:hypothetical protein